MLSEDAPSSGSSGETDIEDVTLSVIFEEFLNLIQSASVRLLLEVVAVPSARNSLNCVLYVVNLAASF